MLGKVMGIMGFFRENFVDTPNKSINPFLIYFSGVVWSSENQGFYQVITLG